jgi:hypothetical protein
VVAWDSGGASFQLTVHGAAGYEVYQGPLGASLVTAMLLQEVRRNSPRRCRCVAPLIPIFTVIPIGK